MPVTKTLVKIPRFGWLTEHRKVRLLGQGGQGVVFLTERTGADQFALPVAFKVFSPENYRDAADYEQDMRRMARVAARVALIQHDNSARRPRFRRAGRHPRHGDGVDRRLRPRHAC